MMMTLIAAASPPDSLFAWKETLTKNICSFFKAVVAGCDDLYAYQI